MADSTKTVNIAVTADPSKAVAGFQAAAQAGVKMGADIAATAQGVKQSLTDLNQTIAKIKEGAASAWTPAISAAKSVEAANRAVAQSAKEAADKAREAVRSASADMKAAAQSDLAAKKAAASEAAAAYRTSAQTATVEQRSAFRQMTADARTAGDAQKQIARDVANVERQAAKETADGQRQAAREVVASQRQAAKEAEQAARRPRGAEYLAQAVGVQGIQQFGQFINGVGGKSGDFFNRSTDLFKESELVKTTISATAGGDVRAQEIFNQNDARSTKSVFSLAELNEGSKVLEGAKLKNEEWAKTIDDLAAFNKENAKPTDVATALRRIVNLDTGEGLERLADFSISKLDLRGKGIEFDGGGAVSDKSQEGINRLLEAIKQITQEKFGGLSERLATTTFAGRESNKQDAQERTMREVGEGAAWAKTKVDALGMSLLSLVGFSPQLNEVAGALGSVGSQIASAVGGGIDVAGQLGQAFIGLQAILDARKSAKEKAKGGSGGIVSTIESVADTGSDLLDTADDISDVAGKMRGKSKWGKLGKLFRFGRGAADVAEEVGDVAGAASKASKYVGIADEMATAGKGLTTLQRGAGVAAGGLEAAGAVAGTATTAIGGLEAAAGGAATAAGAVETGLGAAAVAGTAAETGLGAAAAAGGAAALPIVGMGVAAGVAVFALYKLAEWAGNKLGSSTDNGKGDAADDTNFNNANSTRAKKGLRRLSVEEWQAQETNDDEMTNEQRNMLVRLQDEDDRARKQKKAEDAAVSAQKPSAVPAPVLALSNAQSLGLGGNASAGGLLSGSNSGGYSGPSQGTQDLRNEENPYEAQMDALRREIRHTKGKENAAKKEALQDELEIVRGQSNDWRKGHAGKLRAARENDHAARQAEREQNQAARLAAGVAKVRQSEAFQTQLVGLEQQRDDAKEAKNTAQETALNYEISVIKAQKAYAEAQAQASGESDPRKQGALLEAAGIKRDGALERARMQRDHDANKATQGVPAWGAMMAAMRGESTVNVSGLINPLAGNQVIGDNAAASSVYGGPFRPGMNAAQHVISIGGGSGIASVAASIGNAKPFVTHNPGFNPEYLKAVAQFAANGYQVGGGISNAHLDPANMIAQIMGGSGEYHRRGHEVKAHHSIHHNYDGSTTIKFDEIRLPKDAFHDAVRRLRP